MFALVSRAMAEWVGACNLERAAACAEGRIHTILGARNFVHIGWVFQVPTFRTKDYELLEIGFSHLSGN